MGGRGPQPRARGVGGAPVGRAAHRGGDPRAGRAVPGAGRVRRQRARRARHVALRRARRVRASTPGSVAPPFLPSARRDVQPPALGVRRRRRRTTPTPPIDLADARGTRPLDGVRVLDLTAFWAGPAATHLLATLGADVVKIESPTRPDGMRFATTRPPTDPTGWSTAPRSTAPTPGKRSVTVDFSTPEGRDLVLRLVEHADVVVENFTPRVLANVGLDDDALRRPTARPRPAPHARVRARRPVARPQRLRADHRAGVGHRLAHRHAGDRPAGALHRRPHRGHPRRVRGARRARPPRPHRRGRAGSSCPMAEVALNVAAEPIVTWSASGMLLERDGNRGPRAHRRARTRARATTSGSRSRSDPTTSGAAGRRARRARVGDRRPRSRPAPAAARATTTSTASWPQWFATRDRDDTVAALARRGRARARRCGTRTRQDELPQLAERGFTQSLEHPLVGTGRPSRHRAAGGGLRRALPAHRHPPSGSTPPRCCASVLGLGDDEIAELAARGVTAPGVTAPAVTGPR